MLQVYVESLDMLSWICQCMVASMCVSAHLHAMMGMLGVIGLCMIGVLHVMCYPMPSVYVWVSIVPVYRWVCVLAMWQSIFFQHFAIFPEFF